MIEEKAPERIGEEPEAEQAEAPGGRSFVAEAVRKAVLTGVGALFLTEEGARKLARDWKLPKELASYIVSQAHGAKDEILRVVSQEVRRFFESESFRRQVAKLIGSMAIEVKAEIRFKEAPKGKGAASASSKQRLRHAEGSEDQQSG